MTRFFCDVTEAQTRRLCFTFHIFRCFSLFRFFFRGSRCLFRLSIVVLPEVSCVAAACVALTTSIAHLTSARGNEHFVPVSDEFIFSSTGYRGEMVSCMRDIFDCRLGSSCENRGCRLLNAIWRKSRRGLFRIVYRNRRRPYGFLMTDVISEAHTVPPQFRKAHRRRVNTQNPCHLSHHAYVSNPKTRYNRNISHGVSLVSSQKLFHCT